ncbi:unnamed protein product [Phytophthora lilii]|uniref:Unnamed protein product n=1 Tax=Phytophthora lilii TaxID=2077276 RepID=A0A9W6X9Y4_9STRA|nr:unnamed protein product [Phytophthora lilii]
MCPSCVENQRELAQPRRKIWIIQEVSRIKNELMLLDPVSNFRNTVINKQYRKELEQIFGVPFHFIKKRYLKLLNERNDICHKYPPFRHASVMPSYCSLRESKIGTQEILERAQRRVRQANVKREMSARASWASDIANGITTVQSTASTQTDMSVGSDDTIPNKVKQTMTDLIDQVIARSDDSIPQEVKQTMENMIDQVIAQSELKKKRLSDKSSQTNPEVSTSDAAVRARPQMADVEIDNGIKLTDAAVSAHPEVVDGSMNTEFVDHEEQVEARKWIKKLFEKKENWIALQNKSIDEISDMRLEDPLYHASLIKSRLDRKRKFTNPSENDDSKRSRQSLIDSSTSTSSDQSNIKYKLLWILLNNESLLESAGLKKALEPVLKSDDHKLPPFVDKDSYVWIDRSYVSVFGKDNGRAKLAITEKVDWKSIFEVFGKLVKERDVDVLNSHQG